MFKKTDPNSFTSFMNLFNGNVPIGRLTSDFQVTKLDDVQADNIGSVIKPKLNKFLVSVTQKIIVSNPNGSSVGPMAAPLAPVVPGMSQYLNYPVLVDTSVSITKDGSTSYELMTFRQKQLIHRYSRQGQVVQVQRARLPHQDQTRSVPPPRKLIVMERQLHYLMYRVIMNIPHPKPMTIQLVPVQNFLMEVIKNLQIQHR